MQSNNKTLKICLVILCLLSFRSVGLPQSDGALLFMEKERWKDVKGFEGIYQVSQKGRVRSLSRNYIAHYKYGDVKRSLIGNILPFQLHFRSKKHRIKNERPYAKVVFTNRGKVTSKTIHRLVAIAFIPNPLSLPMVLHKDDDKLNNHVSNLMWGNNSINQRMAFASGLQIPQRGSINGRSYLKKKDILKIRKMYASGNYRMKDLAPIFKTSWQNIGLITSRRNWAHI